MFGSPIIERSESSRETITVENLREALRITQIQAEIFKDHIEPPAGMDRNTFTVLNTLSFMYLLFEIMKEMIKDRLDNDKDRFQDLIEQLENLEKVAANYQKTGKAGLLSAISGGVLGILSGVLPIVGIAKGGAILNKLSGTFPSLAKMADKPEKFFNNFSKIFGALSRTYEQFSNAFENFSRAHGTRSQKRADVSEKLYHAHTKTSHDKGESYQTCAREVKDLMDTLHQTVQQLYN